MINEAIYTLYEGVGNVEAIDNRECGSAPPPMGPLKGYQTPSGSTSVSVMQVLHEGLADSKYRPCRCCGEIRRGRLASPRKVPAHFSYDYRGEKPVPTR